MAPRRTPSRDFKMEQTSTEKRKSRRNLKLYLELLASTQELRLADSRVTLQSSQIAPQVPQHRSHVIIQTLRNLILGIDTCLPFIKPPSSFSACGRNVMQTMPASNRPAATSARNRLRRNNSVRLNPAHSRQFVFKSKVVDLSPFRSPNSVRHHFY